MKVLFFLSRRNTYLLFSRLSDLWRFMSSKISFTADTVITNMSGSRIVGWPPVMEIYGMVYNRSLGRQLKRIGNKKNGFSLPEESSSLGNRC